MRTPEITRLVQAIHDDAQTLAATRGRARPVPVGGRPVIDEAPRLAWVMADVDQWAGLGYPNGGSGASRGGDTTPLPERLAVAGARDACALDLLEATVTLRAVSEGLRWLVAFQARYTPLTPEQCRPQPTATCIGCGRTIAANAIDPVLSGYCTSSRDRVHGGCHADWVEAKREKDRVRQANHRARQRGLEAVEQCEGVTFG